MISFIMPNIVPAYAVDPRASYGTSVSSFRYINLFKFQHELRVKKINYYSYGGNFVWLLSNTSVYFDSKSCQIKVMSKENIHTDLEDFLVYSQIAFVWRY
jgi:hypothetical protein